MDKEHEIPVKVVDRRWWVNQEDSAAGAGEKAAESRKPTYVAELEQQLAEKDRLLQEYLGKYRQASHEFDEARLRLRREISKDVERARREVLSEVLLVLDNLDRAVDSGKTATSLESVLQGIDLVRQQFVATLESLGVSRIDATGHPFDPLLHEAVTTVPAASPADDGVVVGTVRNGYRIGNDVLRPAAVAVAKLG
jgi:molecular chaperone GrpE (heat shock protein)